MPTPSFRAPGALSLLGALALGWPALGLATSPPAPGTAAGASAVPATGGASAAAAAPVALASSAAAQPVGAASAPAARASARKPAQVARDATTASALGELGLALLRQTHAGSPAAAENVVLSPLSLTMALGQVQAGAGGATASELARLLGSARQGRWLYSQGLPALRQRLGNGGPLTQANRLWVDATLTGALQPGYVHRLLQRWGSEVGPLNLKESEQARSAINQWVSQQTQRQIGELMTPGSVSPSARLVLTNALHFKSRWEQPFPAIHTQARPFTLEDGSVVQARSLHDERSVQVLSDNGTTVAALPFAGQAFQLVLALPPEGEKLGRFVQRLRGADWVRWQGRLQPQSCTVSLPRLDLAPVPRSLKASLQALGVKSAFDERADLRPLLGAAARGLHLENVYQAAALTLDETGGEASAATAAVIGVKSARLPAPPCAVFNRPFVFALVHTESGAPLFIGQVANPARN